MKIVFLNTWGGRVGQPLLEFFKNHQDVDVFCLQEVWSNASQED
jgi:exonuclease III